MLKKLTPKKILTKTIYKVKWQSDKLRVSKWFYLLKLALKALFDYTKKIFNLSLNEKKKILTT